MTESKPTRRGFQGHLWFLVVCTLLATQTPGCREPARADRVCQISATATSTPDFVNTLGCDSDFTRLAAEPFDASLANARSVKFVIDRVDGEALYFQNSERYSMHWDFARAHLSGDGLPVVPDLAQFNTTEYSSPSRRFLLGAVTRYEDTGHWVFELAPYDSANAEMIAAAYERLRARTFFGQELWFHPTSEALEVVAEQLPVEIRVITTDELHEGARYQPLNLGVTMGRLRFVTTHGDLDASDTNPRDIVVLDGIPNEISVVMGIITSEFQTPLSHINVLSQNRGTPNMALRDAQDDPQLRALEGQWVRLEVGAFDYSIEGVSQAEADAFWETNRPETIHVPELDLSITELTDIVDLLDPNLPLDEALSQAIAAFGGKASHFAALAMIGEDVPVPRAFAIPVARYRQFMEENGFQERIEALLSNDRFLSDPEFREDQLRELRRDMREAPVDPQLEALLLDKLRREFPGTRMRFRSSTNAEDLDGFSGAGLYDSKSGDPDDPERPVLDALRKVWASLWNFRAFEERSYRGIDHTSLGMAVLVHRSFPDEEANGVALTANPFDTSGMEPGQYINVQIGEESVVDPEPGVTSDELIFFFDMPGRPIRFIAHSNLIAPGETVLTDSQTHRLGVALRAIHDHFLEVYGADATHWYAMDVEFKFDGDPGEQPRLFVKQARPHPGWGL